jgi:hypothetical protein
MNAALKTIEGWRDEPRVRKFLSTPWGFFIFSLGRGRPKRPIERLYFTFRGRIFGWIHVTAVEENTGQYDQHLKTMFGDGWRPGRIICRCAPPFHFIDELVFHRGFQGWRYFDFDVYRNSEAARLAREDIELETMCSGGVQTSAKRN